MAVVSAWRAFVELVAVNALAVGGALIPLSILRALLAASTMTGRRTTAAGAPGRHSRRKARTIAGSAERDEHAGGDVLDPGWVNAGPSAPEPPRFSRAPTHDMPASTDLHERAIAQKPYAVGEGIASSAAGGLVGEVLPLADAPPASSHYGPVAPAWAQRHPRMIFAWASLRALRWLLRDSWRSWIRW